MTVLDADCVMQDIIDAVPCSPEDEKSIVKELWDAAELNEKAGDAYYVVSSRNEIPKKNQRLVKKMRIEMTPNLRLMADLKNGSEICSFSWS